MSKVLAVILAGGQGERLSLLSQKRAKPAVPFAGKYRIIDFALSNCVNSGITDVAVLTQYRPHSLHDHIGIGKPWDLDRQKGGIRLLQPYIGRHESDWYQGTADAVYQNLSLIMETRCDYILILAGDHIYRMDYAPMIAFHEQHRADATLGAVIVPLEEGHRFGILETDAGGRVISFEEKPRQPRGTLGSMGIYVFDRDTLMRVLIEDARAGEDGSPSSQHDFGRNIIPAMMARGERVFAYPFSGYWQDVGTIQSYWEAHMALLSDRPAFDLYDPSWVIHTRSEERPPAHLRSHARVTSSLISHGCIIQGTVERSVLSPGVIVEEGAVVRESIILFDTVIGAGSIVDHAILDKEVIVGKNCQIGYGDDMTTPNKSEPDRLNTGITLIGKRAHLPDNLKVGRNCKIGSDLRPEDFSSDTLASGESIEDRTFSHGWERDLARRGPITA
ncbi:MAG TPA: glucose-1-phosphate adenylyltransferase [Ktedonobacteraceae bacterium]|jgi:glucose-1-phosphate adenylyltransferase|nr:glucose-1-phosphate adenylyltransferase [Ktedonobacteraceae bacterium]